MTDAALADLPETAPEEIVATLAQPPRKLPDHLLRVRVEVEIVLGHLRLPLSEVAALREGAVLALDRKLGDWVDVAINGRVVARGEVVARDDAPDRLGVVIREMVDDPGPSRRDGAMTASWADT